MRQTQTLTLSDGKVIEISLLPLRAYGDLLVTLQGTFKEAVNKFDSLETDDLIAILPEFIQSHMDEAGGIIAVGTRGQVSAREALDERGLGDAIAIIAAIIDVNDVEGMIAQVKKATAVFRKTKVTPQMVAGAAQQSMASPLA